MKRIILHWSAGPHKATRIDKRHYHYIVEGDGNVVEGNFPVSANVKPRKGQYAAHTFRLNTGSIGVSMASMLGAREVPLQYGSAPMTEVQFEACMKLVAKLCKEYNIPVTNKTVLSHAEVQPVLGVKQKGKWDFTVLPFKPELKGWKACGDYARERVKHYMDMVDEPEDKEVARIKYLQKLLKMHGYDVISDGVLGEHTEQAITRYQKDNDLPVTGTFSAETVMQLRLIEEGAKKNISNKPLVKSRTVQGGGVAATGGAIVMIEPVKEATKVLTEQQEAMSSGDIITLIIGAAIILGAAYALYSRWDDAGRPLPWK